MSRALAGDELLRDAERGEVQLGGCDIYDHMPSLACRSCDHQWEPASLDVPSRDRGSRFRSLPGLILIAMIAGWLAALALGAWRDFWGP